MLDCCRVTQASWNVTLLLPSGCARSLSCVWLFAIAWTVARQAPLFMGFSRQEYWREVSFPTPRDLPDPGIEFTSLASPALAGRFFTTSATWSATYVSTLSIQAGLDLLWLKKQRGKWHSQHKLWAQGSRKSSGFALELLVCYPRTANGKKPGLTYRMEEERLLSQVTSSLDTFSIFQISVDNCFLNCFIAT